MKSEKNLVEEQSIGGRIATWAQMLFALGCIVLFFFPFFRFLDVDSMQFAAVSQYQLLFGGIFPKIGLQTIRVDGSISFLTGILVPIFMVLVLYFRNSVRRMFAYIFHALVSIAFLVYIFSTRSVASSIVRLNSDAVNYQVDWAWFATALLTVAGFAFSVLLIISELSRLRDRQEMFEQEESAAEKEQEEDPKPSTQKNPEDDGARLVSAPVVHEEISKEQTPATTAEDDFNQVITEAISSDDDYYTDDPLTEEEEKLVEALENEQQNEEVAEQIPEEQEKVSKPVRVAVKVKVKPKEQPTKEVRNTPATNRSVISQKMPARPVKGVRGITEDFDEHSGY